MMRGFVGSAVARACCGLFAFLVCGLFSPTVAQETHPPGLPAVLTNLLQLRVCAERTPAAIHPFRIMAAVLDADATNGVLALRDASGVEFVQLDLRDQEVAPGSEVLLEGNGCGVKPRRFGLEIVPGMVVDNDGLHGAALVSGTVFLHAGINPIRLEWFNGLGGSSLDVEYGGTDLPRQRIPGSVLMIARIDPSTGATNFSQGLDYRSYEGTWVRLPDFSRRHPVRVGVVTNFDVSIATIDRPTALEFGGFIKIPHDGEYTFYLTSDDGSRLFVGESSLKIDVISHGPAPSGIEKVPATDLERNSRPWMTLEGNVKFVGVRGTGGELVMRVGGDDIRVGILEGGDAAPNFPTDTQVRVSGVYQDVFAEDGSRVPGMLLVSSWKAVRSVVTSERTFIASTSIEKGTNQMVRTVSAIPATPTITTALEVKALTIEIAKRQLPVKICGVVTAVLPAYLHGAVVQDSTKGIFVSLDNLSGAKPLQLGEFYQVEGVTGPGSFAPIIVAQRIKHLGAGLLPEPLHATWNQLKNGSLDTQYAEIEGAVTAIHQQQIEMLTGGGIITLVLDDLQPEDLTGYDNAMIQIRGCAFALFNMQTRELDASSLRILGGTIEVVQPPPHDVFDTVQKSLGELLLYDAKATPFRRLKVAGQIIYGGAGDYFLSDGTNGVRISAAKGSNVFSVRDMVEAVGFLELGGPFAELKQAVMRRTGSAPLPEPRKLAPNDLLLARYSSTLVQVEATLLNQWREGTQYVLGLQSGYLTFRGRVDSDGKSVRIPPNGSRLELTGVYSPQGNRSDNGTVSGFEVLLSSAAGIRVLAAPPWWTFKRALILAGVLAALLCVVLIWNKELHRLVQERTRKLEAEIQNRQRAELQRAAEAERSRISRDLHDELGAGLTEVSLLANAGIGRMREVKENDDRFRVIADKARALVSGLDVLVWAIDPGRNSLQSFADYLGRYATELFSESGIVCRFKIPIECKAVILTEAARHSLFLAVKEALNNVIRHASATEVRLQMTQANSHLEIVVADNGRGFDWKRIRRGNGLANLHERLEALDGECHIESKIGNGTTVKFVVSLPCHAE